MKIATAPTIAAAAPIQMRNAPGASVSIAQRTSPPASQANVSR